MITWLKKWFKPTQNNQIAAINSNQIAGNHNFIGVKNDINRSVNLENSHVGIVITGDHVTVQYAGLPPEVLTALEKLLNESLKTQKHLNELVEFKESKLEQLQKEAEEWINRYNSLSKDLESLRQENPDYVQVLSKAEEFLKQGKFSEVTTLLEPLKTKGDEKTKQNAKVHFMLGQAYLLDNKPVQALPEYEAAYHHDFKNVVYGFEYAKLLQKQNEYKKARRLFESLLDELKQLSESEQQIRQNTVLAVMGNLAIIYADTQEREEAEKLYQETLNTYRELAQTNPQIFLPEVAKSLNNLANLVQVDSARREEAEKLYRKALKIKRELAQSIPQVSPPYVASTLNNLANLVAKDPARREEAEKLHREALKIRRDLESNPQVFLPDVAMTLNNLALLVASDPARREEAEQGYQEALKIYRDLAQSNPQVFLPDVAMTLNNLAFLYFSTNDFKAAMSLIDEAINIRQQFFATTPAVFGDDLASSLAIKGLIHSGERQTLEACTIFREALQTAQTDRVKEAIKHGIAKLNCPN